MQSPTGAGASILSDSPPAIVRGFRTFSFRQHNGNAGVINGRNENSGMTARGISFTPRKRQRRCFRCFQPESDAPDGGVRFFAQYLCPPKLWPVFINSGAQLDEGIRPILRRAEGGLVVIRMVNWFSPTHQSGLLGLVREASREGIRVAALSAEPLTALAERGECSEALANAFSKRVIQVPPLNAYQEDIPKIVALMVRRLGTETDLTGRRLTTQAVNFLCNRSYENDFAELTAIVRGALLVAAEGKADATVVAAMAEKVGGVGAGVGAEAFSLPLREAREIFEREYFRRLIRAARGNMQRAAQAAGLERAYFYRKLKQLQIKD